MPVIKKYTHLFFDLDNTLWDFESNSIIAMEDAFNKFIFPNTKIDFDLFFRKYSFHNRMLWQAYRSQEIMKKELIIRRFQDTFDELKITGIDPEKMNDYYLAQMPKQTLLVEGVADILNYLKEKKYKLFIITNGFTEVQHQKLTKSGIKNYFDKIFISEEIKSPKPSNEIFEYAIKSSNAKKAKSLMIGDDWDSDICGAVNYGIDAVFFAKNSKNNIELKTKLNVYQVSKMAELYNIL